jgi:hypothetical protein
MGSNFSLFYDFIVENYGTENTFNIFYVLNLIFGVIAYKLGFARKLSLLKNIVVYILLAIGMFIITLFSSIGGYPITESLIVISAVLGIYRYRLHKERKEGANTQ